MSYYIFKSNRTKIILTPMIDVLFIILIFFMLVSNFNLNRGISLQSGSSSEASLSRHTLAVVDLNEIRISLNGVEVERDFLVQKLHKLSKNNGEIQIFLRPSGEFSVQNIINLIDELTAQGLSNIYILDE